MTFEMIIGYSASILSTIAFLPQAIYVIRTRDTQSISLLTYSIFVLSVIFWFIYGIMLEDLPILLSNLVCIISGGVILYYKCYERKYKNFVKEGKK